MNNSYLIKKQMSIDSHGNRNECVECVQHVERVERISHIDYDNYCDYNDCDDYDDYDDYDECDDQYLRVLDNGVVEFDYEGKMRQLDEDEYERDRIRREFYEDYEAGYEDKYCLRNSTTNITDTLNDNLSNEFGDDADDINDMNNIDDVNNVNNIDNCSVNIITNRNNYSH